MKLKKITIGADQDLKATLVLDSRELYRLNDLIHKLVEKGGDFKQVAEAVELANRLMVAESQAHRLYQDAQKAADAGILKLEGDFANTED